MTNTYHLTQKDLVAAVKVYVRNNGSPVPANAQITVAFKRSAGQRDAESYSAEATVVVPGPGNASLWGDGEEERA